MIQCQNEVPLDKLALLMDYKHLGQELSHHDSSFIFQPYRILELSYQVKVNTYLDQDLSFEHLKAFLILYLFCTKVGDGVLLKYLDYMLLLQVYSFCPYSSKLF